MTERERLMPVAGEPYFPDSDFAPDYPRHRPVNCAYCEWQGTYGQAGIGEVSEQLGYWILVCPNCEAKLKFLEGPTYEEVLSEANLGNPNAIAVLDEYQPLGGGTGDDSTHKNPLRNQEGEAT